jgi:hypothetical protein
MRALIATTVVLLGLATPAYASCVQGDFAGRWQIYMMRFGDGCADWVRCALRIGRDGVIRDTTCRTSDRTVLELKDGRIALVNGTRCTFAGRFTLGRDRHAIVHMTLAADKLKATGVGDAEPASLVEYALLLA